MNKYILILLLGANITSGFSQSLYFPPLLGSEWDTVSPQSLGWCTAPIDSLYDYLETQNSRSFIVLKDGKIVMERYFNGFNRDSLWYWASAGKTLTACLVGKAQEEGKLKLTDTTSTYLGSGWTSLPDTAERKITIWHQLTMTSGLDDGVSDEDCTLSTCLQYKAEPGMRWAYHNAPYTLLERVVEEATGVEYNLYTLQKIKALTGMTGFWVKNGLYNNVYVSNARSMARFGLMIQAGGKWKQTTVLSDTAFVSQMIRTTQPHNLSYGYLWWLNGQPSFMAPGIQTPFLGSWAPAAPNDVYAALGKDGQVISISPSLGVVVVRAGESPDSIRGAVSFNIVDGIWRYLNRIICQPVGEREMTADTAIRLYPNPAQNKATLSTPQGSNIRIVDLQGRVVYTCISAEQETILPVHQLEKGMYTVLIQYSTATSVHKLLVN